jgi:predicted nucleic acid-binding protein
VSDAALTALAIENGAALASTDRDFSRFRGLQWVHPFDS